MSLILSVAVYRGVLALLNNQLHRRDVIFLVKYSHRGQFWAPNTISWQNGGDVSLSGPFLPCYLLWQCWVRLNWRPNSCFILPLILNFFKNIDHTCRNMLNCLSLLDHYSLGVETVFSCSPLFPGLTLLHWLLSIKLHSGQRYGMCIWWNITQPSKETKLDHLQWCGWTYSLSYRVKSERQKQILHINAYIWILEKWYWWTYLQGRNRDADVENRLVDMVIGRGESGTNWGSSIDMYTLPCVK